MLSMFLSLVKVCKNCRDCFEHLNNFFKILEIVFFYKLTTTLCKEYFTFCFFFKKKIRRIITFESIYLNKLAYIFGFEIL